MPARRRDVRAFAERLQRGHPCLIQQGVCRLIYQCGLCGCDSFHHDVRVVEVLDFADGQCQDAASLQGPFLVRSPPVAVDDAARVQPVMWPACAQTGHRADYLIAPARRKERPVRKEQLVQPQIQAVRFAFDEQEFATAAQDGQACTFGKFS